MRDTDLIEAVLIDRDAGAAVKAIEGGANPNVTLRGAGHCYPRPLLFAASRAGDLDMVIALIQGGADVHWRANDGYPANYEHDTTAAQVAASAGHLDVLEALLDSGIRLGEKDAHYGAFVGHSRCVLAMARYDPRVVRYVRTDGVPEERGRSVYELVVGGTRWYDQHGAAYARRAWWSWPPDDVDRLVEIVPYTGRDPACRSAQRHLQSRGVAVGQLADQRDGMRGIGRLIAAYAWGEAAGLAAGNAEHFVREGMHVCDTKHPKSPESGNGTQRVLEPPRTQ